jgi:hypothetical protein
VLPVLGPPPAPVLGRFPGTIYGANERLHRAQQKVWGKLEAAVERHLQKWTQCSGRCCFSYLQVKKLRLRKWRQESQKWRVLDLAGKQPVASSTAPLSLPRQGLPEPSICFPTTILLH